MHRALYDIVTVHLGKGVAVENLIPLQEEGQL
jgi:hypothetical protein